LPDLDFWIFGFLDFWNTIAQRDSLFHKSLLFVTRPVSKYLENQADSRAGCSKKARIRAV